MTFSHALSTNRYGEGDLIVSTSAANGTHTTLVSAMAAAVSGQTIFLRDSVTENVTLTAGVNIAAWTGGTLNTPTITGTITMTAAGTCNISGIRLQTNSAAALAVTGSAASIVNLENCYLNFTNNTGITFSSSDSGARINIYNCRGNLGTTGIALFAHSSAGIFLIAQSDFTNTGLSTQANTVSSGTLGVRKSLITNPTTTSSTSAFIAETSAFSTEAQNVTALTIGGSNSQELYFCGVAGGSASAITISSALTISLSDVSSTNTNAITGAGAIDYYGIAFSGTSTTINTTTKTIAGTLQGSKNTAPTAGFLGEQIRATRASGSALALTTSTGANVTSISLTPGIWDISAVIQYSANAATSCTIYSYSISPTSATLDISGDDSLTLVFTTPAVGYSPAFTIPSYRVTLSATTTYYLVGAAVFTVNSMSVYGRLSATRVG